MRPIADFANKLYSYYVIGLYFVCMAIILLQALLLAWLPDRPRLRIFYRFARGVTFCWELLTGIRFRILGREKIDPHTAYVFVVNHLSLLDILLTGTCIPHDFKPLSKVEIFRIPVIGQIFHLIAIPVDRRSRQSRMESLNTMVETIQKGTSLLVFPEGTRNRSIKPLESFYDGAFTVAIKAQAPIFPIVSLGTRRIQPVDTLRVHPGTAGFVYLDPIPTEGMTLEDLPALKQQTFEAMWDYIVSHDPFFGHTTSV